LACTRYASGLKGPKVATGIVSWGQGCGEANHAGVYTRVESYITWINEALGKWRDARWNGGFGSKNFFEALAEPD